MIVNLICDHITRNCLVRQKRTMKDLNQETVSPDNGMNPGPLVYTIGVKSTQWRLPVSSFWQNVS